MKIKIETKIIFIQNRHNLTIYQNQRKSISGQNRVRLFYLIKIKNRFFPLNFDQKRIFARTKNMEQFRF